MHRALRRIILAAAMGVGTTYLTAWLCTWLLRPDPSDLRSAMWSVARPGTMIAAGQVQVRIENGRCVRGLAVASTLPAPSPDEMRIAARMLEGMSDDQQRQVRSAMSSGVSRALFFASGWPMLAVSFETDNVRGPLGGWEISPLGTRAGAPNMPPRAIAWRPLWPGFVINSAIFAAGWWIALVAPGAIVHARRTRKGWCPTCGYDLRGAVGARCPECGAT